MSPSQRNQYLIFVIVSFCMILICTESLSQEGLDVSDRKKLVAKYKNTVKADLEFILLKEKKKDEDWRDLINMVVRLNDDKSAKMTELLVDLIDFHIGEMTNTIIYEHVSGRKTQMVIALLRNKLLKKPLSFEKDPKERNEIIADLLRHIVNNVKYIYNPSYFDPVEVLKSWLFGAQMDLEKYYYENGVYPEKLSDAFRKKDDIVIVHGKNVKIEYKSFGATYFIGTTGKDGILGTKDDVLPPYLSEIYSFPRTGK